MKKFLICIALMAIPAAVWAGGQVQYTTTGSAGTVGQDKPLSASVGIPTTVGGLPVKSATVTFQSVWDGGDPDEFIFANAIAFKYDSFGTGSDGGVGYTWSRIPQLDVIMDAGIPILGNWSLAQSSISATIAVPEMPSGSRLMWMYKAISAGAPDGGTTTNAIVNIQGRY